MIQLVGFVARTCLDGFCARLSVWLPVGLYTTSYVMLYMYYKRRS